MRQIAFICVKNCPKLFYFSYNAHDNMPRKGSNTAVLKPWLRPVYQELCNITFMFSYHLTKLWGECKHAYYIIKRMVVQLIVILRYKRWVGTEIRYFMLYNTCMTHLK